jgi:hypothetical protein
MDNVAKGEEDVDCDCVAARGDWFSYCLDSRSILILYGIIVLYRFQNKTEIAN